MVSHPHPSSTLKFIFEKVPKKKGSARARSQNAPSGGGGASGGGAPAELAPELRDERLGVLGLHQRRLFRAGDGQRCRRHRPAWVSLPNICSKPFNSSSSMYSKAYSGIQLSHSKLFRLATGSQSSQPNLYATLRRPYQHTNDVFMGI